MGMVPRRSLLGRVTEDGDGVVSVKSAKLEGAVSDISVAADHVEVHRHPLAILEVRRILLEHMAAVSQPPSFAAAPPAPINQPAMSPAARPPAQAWLPNTQPTLR